MERLFEGLKVIDFTMAIAGPVIGSMLADFGADVIKVEKPGLVKKADCKCPRSKEDQ